MFIVDSPPILFIHIQKTGGATLTQALASAFPSGRHLLGTHDGIAAARAALQGELDKYFRFAFVRNPWDRLVSWYTMIVSRYTDQTAPWRLWQYVRETASTFDEFVEKCTDTIDDVDGRKSFMFNQLDYLTDTNGRVNIDFIGRFENFEADARSVLDRLGVRPGSLETINATPHAAYRSCYTPRTRQIVAERYARDIEYFGYRF